MYRRILNDITNMNNNNIIIKRDQLKPIDNTINNTINILDCSIVIDSDTTFDIKIHLKNYPFEQPSYQIYPVPSIESNNDDTVYFLNGTIFFNDNFNQKYPCAGRGTGLQMDLEKILIHIKKFYKPIISEKLRTDMMIDNNMNIIVLRDTLRTYNNMNVTLRINIIVYTYNNKYNNKNNIGEECYLGDSYEIFMETRNYPTDMLSYRIHPIPSIKKNDMVSFPNGWVLFNKSYNTLGIFDDMIHLISLIEENMINL